MFRYLHETAGLALRLPGDLRERFLLDYDARLCVAYGVVQKEYVAVPAALFADTGALKPWFAASVEYARTLKVKPSKKRV